MGKILIVENGFVITQDLRKIVFGLGHVVMGMAKSAHETIKKIAKEAVDLIVLDIHIIRDIRSTQLASKTGKEYGLPFLYVISYSDSGTLSEMTPTNPLEYILKPFDERDIKDALELGFRKIDVKNSLPSFTLDISTYIASVSKKIATLGIISGSEATAKTLQNSYNVFIH